MRVQNLLLAMFAIITLEINEARGQFGNWCPNGHWVQDAPMPGGGFGLRCVQVQPFNPPRWNEGEPSTANQNLIISALEWIGNVTAKWTDSNIKAVAGTDYGLSQLLAGQQDTPRPQNYFPPWEAPSPAPAPPQASLPP